MSWIAAGVGTASALGSAYTSYEGGQNQADAIKQGAQTQANALQQAIEQYQANANKSTPMFQPWLNAGTSAQNTLAQLLQPGGALYNAPNMNNWRADPAYLNIKNQAMKAIQAMGGRYSGQGGVDMEQMATQLADQQYNSIYNRKLGEQNTLARRLGGLSESGFNAARTISDINTGTANRIGTTLGDIGQVGNEALVNAAAATASGMQGSMKGINSGIGMGMNIYGANQQNDQWQQLLNQLNNTNTNTGNLGTSVSPQSSSGTPNYMLNYPIPGGP